MSATFTVGSAEGQNPTTFTCTAGATSLNVIVSAASLILIPTEEQTSYCQARALLATGDSAGATNAVTPLASGTAGPPETRNWAQLWLDGEILS